MRDRLIELLRSNNAAPEKTCPRFGTGESCEGCKYLTDDIGCDYIARQADYLLANGVIVPPCKVGAVVYVLRSQTSNGKNLYLREERIDHYRVFDKMAFMVFESGRTSVPDYLWETTVFLTREEAEAALRKEDEGK